MKLIASTVAGIVMLAVLSGCDSRPKSVGEKVEDKVKDGLDARPNEKLKDAGEEIRDNVRDVTK